MTNFQVESLNFRPIPTVNTHDVDKVKSSHQISGLSKKKCQRFLAFVLVFAGSYEYVIPKQGVL